MRLKGRSAVITGAAQGLGYAVAERFLAEGASVMLTDIQGEKVQEAAKRLASGGGKVLGAAVDVTSRLQVEDMAARAIRELGHVDILVNNAGGSGDKVIDRIEDVTEEIWDAVVNRNLKGTYLCCRALVPHMKERTYGRIVNFSSNIAKGTARSSPTAGALLPYAASKAGIQGLTFQLAKELARWNIVVNVVVPGFVLTEPGARLYEKFKVLDPAAQQAVTTRSPRGMPGRPDELAAAVLFLASEECSFVSGVAMDVTGAA